MKKTFVFTIIYTLISMSFVFAQMNFEHSDWQSVQAKAKKEKKLIFVDAYTEWCGPCKMMTRNTFTDKEVGNFYNANFINYKLDMEKGEGLTFATTYGVNAYPTLLYIKPDGSVHAKILGYQTPAQFVTAGKSIIDAYNNASAATNPKAAKTKKKHWWQFWKKSK